MHKKQNHIYVGLDLHKDTHTAVIIDCWEEKLGLITIENKPSDFTRLMNKVNKIAGDLTPVYGLEDVHGYGRSLAVFLIEKGMVVKEVNSALSYMERMSYPTTQKSDDWDARCIASVLLRKLDTLPDANPQDLYWTIKMMVNRRNSIVKSITNLTNQLHENLNYNYPSYKKFFSDVNSKTALAFYEKYPSPKHLKGVTDEELAEFLRKPSHNSCSTRKAKEILDLVESDGDTTREYQESRDLIIQSIVRDIAFKSEEIKKVEVEMKKLLKLLDLKLETIPGIDTVTAIALVAHIGDIKRFRNADKLAKFSGIAPVNFSSAGKGKDKKSKQGNRELYGVFYFLAVQQIQVSKKGTPRNPVFLEYYKRKVSEGKTKIQALVCVMRRLNNIIYGMMKNKTEYVMPSVEIKEVA
ncbi:IS110 family transposase [Clostridium botulinum]|uniref:IS110 family transposase n=2 Tax=Clostridium TaxID=1485 RepID=A0A6B4JLA8_CLOBO|nr:IS110 family transposase [Clostridium botulinum]EES51154.1 transposase [Clostridium botulinum E1 str. 'BoNT E Beluga']MBY6761147.1 IS110 family transposase [Clostridium botulinum]MBY6921375.1 IS110 family transposase [Clostridium botulinum]MCR1132056.1 IS110 family transposase [Clostridium botulinum]NFJ57826.1 IS110 family transposase [Clostridium botulinum]